MTPSVTVVVPTFGAGPYLVELCASLLKQTHPDFRVLILSDGGNDHVQPGLDRYRSDPRFHIESWSPNRGVARATERLLQQVQTPFWCYPGADDRLDPDFVGSRLAAMERMPGASVIFGPGRQIDESGKEAWYHPTRILDERMAQFDGQTIDSSRMLNLLLQENVVNTPSVFCRTEATVPVLVGEAIPWGYAQDYHYWLALAARGRLFGYDRSVLHSYRMHSGQLSRKPAVEARRHAEIRLVPLVALAQARNTEIGGTHWRRWGEDCYALWLMRALSLIRRRRFDWHWQDQASAAFHGKARGRAGFAIDLIRFGPSMIAVRMAYGRLLPRQIWVNGLRRIDDPVFRRPGAATLPEFAR